MTDIIKKAAGAAIMIALGNYVLLKIGSPIGPFLFAFGLLGVCVLQLNLFTGKCGFWKEKNIPLKTLGVILLVNLIAGYAAGLVFGIADPAVKEAAVEKLAVYAVSIPFFIKSVLCGIVMYVAVKEYGKGNVFGILLGVPLFIFCGWQHCIANIITIGAAGAFSVSLLLSILVCIAGNFCGSLLMSFLCCKKSEE